jgi:hypothetical protein
MPKSSRECHSVKLKNDGISGKHVEKWDVDGCGLKRIGSTFIRTLRIPPRPASGAFCPMSRYRVGRALQLLGLLILPFGIASELYEKVGLGQSLLIAACGALVFYVGYIIQGPT